MEYTQRVRNSSRTKSTGEIHEGEKSGYRMPTETKQNGMRINYPLKTSNRQYQQLQGVTMGLEEILELKLHIGQNCDNQIQNSHEEKNR